MLRRLPLILGAVAGLAALLLVGPVAIAVALLGSTPEVEGPTPGGKALIVLFAIGLSLLAAVIAWGLAWILLRALRR